MYSLSLVVRSLLTERRWYPALATIIIAGDFFLTCLIIRFVSFTEIDWETYMIQVSAYIQGERDYVKISGPTGPLVYPAGHLYIHTLLYYFTNGGSNLFRAQLAYCILYITSLTTTAVIYYQAGSPNWLLLALPLSKRLHSIYVLRLFNDCWSVLAAQLAVAAFQRAYDVLGTVLIGIAISVKMSALLYVPGVLAVLALRRGPLFAVVNVIGVAALQVVFGLPFIVHDGYAYLHNAFDFSRIFLYKWTVNWRMIPEDVFLSQSWALSLMVGHITALAVFATFRWLQDENSLKASVKNALKHPERPMSSKLISPMHVTAIIFTSNLIGVTFARSLHYQFYSWYAYQIPLLAYHTPYPMAIKLSMIALIEYAWNTFPSTVTSSAGLLAGNSALLIGQWLEHRDVKVPHHGRRIDKS